MSERHELEDTSIAISKEDSADELYVTNDGRVSIRANSKLFNSLSKLLEADPALQSEEPTEDLPGYSKHPPIHLKLNIVVQIVGSRGDVQPFIALGVELQRHGHRVRIATHDVFRQLITESGLEFFGVGGNPSDLMAYMVKNPGLMPSMQSLRSGDVQRKREMVGEMLVGFWRSCIEPDEITKRPFVADVIVANPPGFAHVHCAQMLGVPLHLMFTMPWSTTTAFPHPLVNIDFTDSNVSPAVANYLSYLAVEFMTWQGLGDVINSWRASLGLERIASSEGPSLVKSLQVPFTYCWSEALIPKPKDWPSYIDITGYMFRDEPDYKPDTDIARFLQRGPPPIYVGFGSIVVENADRLTQTIVEAVRIAGIRAIVSHGWSNLGANVEPDPNILYINDCPHEWLFKHVSMVIHHGGAGTTACGFLNARPTVIVPFFGDQPFWGMMVANVGAGPRPIPHARLTSENLAEAIRFCLADEAIKAAGTLRDKILDDHGTQDAVDSVHRHLPVDNMRCDLLPDHPAVWLYRKNGKQHKLSKVAVAILVHHAVINRKKLERYETKPVDIRNVRWDPLTATTSSLMSTTKGMVTSVADIFIKPVQVYTSDSESSRKLATRSIEGGESSRSQSDRTISETASATPSTRSATQKFGKAIAGSAAGVGGFFHHYTKGMLLDLPLAATEGMHAIPKLYGSDVRDHGPVKDWKSGMIVAGKNLSHGFADGVSDLVKEPIKGAKEGGVTGGVVGIGKGALNAVSKMSSGALGLVSYPGQGIYKSVVSLTNRDARKAIEEALRAEGQYLLESQEDRTLEQKVLDAFALRTA